MVAWAIGKDEPLGFRRMVVSMEACARNLLVLQLILDVDWGATFRGKSKLNTGSWFYYDYKKGLCTGIRLGQPMRRRNFAAVELKFVSGRPTTLTDSDAEVLRYNFEDNRARRDERAAGAAGELAEERMTTPCEVWRNVFTSYKMRLPLSTGEVVNFLLTVLRSQHSAQDDVRTMRAQNVELCMEMYQVRAQLETARTEVTRDREGVDLESRAETAAGDAKKQAEAALHLAEATNEIAELMEAKDTARADVRRLTEAFKKYDVEFATLKERQATVAKQVTGGRWIVRRYSG